MKTRNSTYLMFASLIVIAIGLWGVLAPGPTEAEVAKEKPASVEHVDGSEISRVTLTQRAAERLDIQTAETRDEQFNGAARRVVPYSAVIYDPEGNAWTYTNPEPLVYMRAPITIERIEGDLAILTDGPAVGTQVVTVGGVLLYGTEFGVGH